MRPKTLAQRLIALRQKHDIDLFELSKTADVREQTLRTWESGRTEVPDAAMLVRVADALETTPKFLLTGVKS